jgi:hypothetical protein
VLKLCRGNPAIRRKSVGFGIEEENALGHEEYRRERETM